MDSWLHVVVVEDEEDGAAARAAIAWFSAGVDGDIFASTRGKRGASWYCRENVMGKKF